MANRTIGNNLRIVRKRNGLTQADAAKLIGSSLVSYSEYELSKKQIPLSKLVLFCDHFKISIERLVKGKNLEPGDYHYLQVAEAEEIYQSRLDEFEERLDRLEQLLDEKGKQDN